MSKLPRFETPDLLVGMETMDDAGVYRLSPEQALVQTVDFFYPIVNDPGSFGRIVAANSLSDIWAMGARAITAMNHLAYPAGQIPAEAIEALLSGGSEKLTEAGVALMGGHTLEQTEMVYGMSVTGLIHPERATRNASVRPGQLLVLTKPLGTGIYCNAYRQEGLSPDLYRVWVEGMERLNMYAARILEDYDTGGMTDVTGFGLLGHALPMARYSGSRMVFSASSVPLLPGLPGLMDEYNPQGVCKCRQFVADHLEVREGIDSRLVTVFSESQTSGGLLFSVNPAQAEEVLKRLHEEGDTASAIVGHVEKRQGHEPLLRVEP